ncbi:MAG: radical SAM protein [Nitrospirota bacterium]|jgi:wyosine [tRNA(Phe)-imidazoG37] synthetase (radical SAM superfamily)|nr:radical SAM protein [Nitrospirota bacterium]
MVERASQPIPRFVYGPVPSRRLGQSLGIDPIPFKTCNWNCVYCQLGRSTPMTNERRDYFPPDEIVGEVKVSIESHEPGEIDWITFAGSGEPTLHVSLGRMIEQIKGLTDIPVAVITNGALLYQPEVRKDLIQADAVLPSLDAGSEALYRKINRPWPELTFERVVSGLTTFRREYTGKLWIEVMLIKGVNDTEPALKDLARVINGIGPDEVHLNLPIRPPSEPWVNPSGEEGLARARTMLGGVAKVVPPAGGVFDLSTYDDVMDAVIGVITRHPMLEEEILQTLKRWTPGQVEDALARLSESGKAKVVSRYGKRFWSCTSAKYA